MLSEITDQWVELGDMNFRGQPQSLLASGVLLSVRNSCRFLLSYIPGCLEEVALLYEPPCLALWKRSDFFRLTCAICSNPHHMFDVQATFIQERNKRIWYALSISAEKINKPQVSTDKLVFLWSELHTYREELVNWSIGRFIQIERIRILTNIFLQLLSEMWC